MVTASEGVLVMLEGEEGDLMEVHVLGRDGDGGVALAWDVGLWAWPEVWGEGAALEQDGASISRWDARARPGRWCTDCQSTEAWVRSASTDEIKMIDSLKMEETVR